MAPLFDALFGGSPLPLEFLDEIYPVKIRRMGLTNGEKFHDPNFSRFYRAMHFSAKRGIAIACRLSVRPSVCDVGEL